MRFVLIAIYLILLMPITGSWWAEGSNILLDPTQVCKKTRRLNGKLSNICKNETALLKEITKGINMGFRECENQFRNIKWNCSTLKKSMRRILMKDTRETAFVNAITAAGVTYAVTKACTMGDLVECSCDKNQYNNNPMNNFNNINNIDLNNNNILNNNNNNSNNNRKRKSNNDNDIIKNNNNNKNNNNKINNKKKNKKKSKLIVPDGKWKWSGCDDNVNFGYKKSKEFLDGRLKKRSDIKTLVKLHNNDAGRWAVKQHMRVECKCHGLSASCTMKTCWMKMAPFSEVASRLKDRFDGAAKVIAKNDGTHFMPEGSTIKTPTRRDLVYTEESPDFCRPNPKTGSLGTQGRECNNTSDGVDGCDLLCCNRGKNKKIINVTINCNCTFEWCCQVNCMQCKEQKEIYTCM